MDFWEKLDQLTRERGKAKVSDEAGLPLTAISNYISKRQLPRIDAAFKLAKALKVPLDWLIDDSTDLPAPEPAEKSLRDVHDHHLMFEVCRRQRKFQERLLEAIDAAGKADWQAADTLLAKLRPGDSIPASVEPLVGVSGNLRHADFFIDQFEPAKIAPAFHAALPGSDRPVSFFDRHEMNRRRKELGLRPGFNSAMDRLAQHESWRNDQSGLELQRLAKTSPDPASKRADESPPPPKTKPPQKRK